MSRNPNIAVITIGYNSFAFEDAHAALELMELMSKAVQVDNEPWSLREISPCFYFPSEESVMPELKFVAKNRFNPEETIKEVKARHEREQADRQDVDQQFNEAPTAPRALAAPAAEVVEEEVIF